MTRALRVLAAALLVAACASEVRVPPPSPAPARAERGFRALTPEGVALVYDARRRVYAVTSQPGAYWLDGRYFRRGADGWLEGASATGPWRACPDADVPEGLRDAR